MFGDILKDVSFLNLQEDNSVFLQKFATLKQNHSIIFCYSCSMNKSKAIVQTFIIIHSKIRNKMKNLKCFFEMMTLYMFYK